MSFWEQLLFSDITIYMYWQMKVFEIFKLFLLNYVYVILPGTIQAKQHQRIVSFPN